MVGRSVHKFLRTCSGLLIIAYAHCCYMKTYAVLLFPHYGCLLLYNYYIVVITSLILTNIVITCIIIIAIIILTITIVTFHLYFHEHLFCLLTGGHIDHENKHLDHCHQLVMIFLSIVIVITIV